MDQDTQPQPRVNGSMLPKYQGSVVCLLGRVKEIDPNGTSFMLGLSDNVDVQVQLQDPLQDMIEGITEVIGHVGQNSRVINCIQYVNLGEMDFDLTLYDEALKITHDFAEFYMPGV
ncbi:replication protein A 14 kDa subunit-like [Asterias rubens]|uniref:replication protein A 14 kDa subunit-like n=1 Tax=Asterias rubens TaxID=7604 RepID=UPI00145534DB|nr:replication protein A 14 kDa subunit-like [Asterias rubens]